MHHVGVLLYNSFELLDVFGPLEFFGWRNDLFSIQLIGLERGPVESSMKVRARRYRNERADAF